MWAARGRPRAPAMRRRGAASDRWLRLSALLHGLQHLGATLSPRVELVRREPVAPRLHRFLALAVEPVGAPELVVRFDQVRSEHERLLKEGLRVLEHVTLEIHQAEIEVRVQRRLAV